MKDPRQQLEAWLEFGAELGLSPYFRVRTPSLSASPHKSAAAAVKPQAAGPRSAREAGAATPSARTFVVEEPRRPVPCLGPAATGQSLFEAVSRIEGDTLPRIREDIGPACSRCKLHKSRSKIVFGTGNPSAQLVFVGEGPGHDEDVQGEPFVGRAGKLLTQMIEAMGLRRGDVYICNVVKCRPPENRLPERDEIATCSPFLIRQLEAIRPKAICCLGACAAQTLLETNQGISRFRGEWFDWRGAKLIATYHPAYLLRNPAAKGEVWKDLQKVMALLGIEPPPGGGTRRSPSQDPGNPGRRY